MRRKELEARTKKFALDVIRFANSLPRRKGASVLGNQLLRSGTSVGSNYREAVRAESRKDFHHKIGLVTKEASESEYWVELLIDSGISTGAEARALRAEASELLAIFTAIGRTLKENDASMQIRDATDSASGAFSIDSFFSLEAPRDPADHKS